MNTRISLYIAALISLSGCGAYNNGASAYNYKIPKSSSVTATDPSSTSGPGYDCQATQAITLSGGPSDGSGKYKVCTSRTSLTDIQLQGRAMHGNQICVYPVRVVGSDAAQAQFDNGGNPVSSCVTLNASAASPLIALTFPGVTFNALAVVDLTDEFGRQQKDTMDQCLRTRMYSSCPVYSYGVFR